MSLKILNQMAWDAAFLEAREKNPGIPDWKLRKDVKAPVYSDANIHSTVAAIFAHLKLLGYEPKITPSYPRYRENNRVQTSHVEFSRDGRLIAIEIQMDNFREPEEARSIYRKKIEGAGGSYVVVHSYQDYADRIESLN